MNYGRTIVKVGCEGRRDEVVTACFKGILMLRKRTKTLCKDDQSVGQEHCLSPTLGRVKCEAATAYQQIKIAKCGVLYKIHRIARRACGAYLEARQLNHFVLTEETGSIYSPIRKKHDSF